MSQLGAVVVSESRVFQQDGVRSHSAMLPLAEAQFPGEKFMEAEYDFEGRRWGYGGNEDDALRLLGAERVCLLRAFALEQWADADALMRFCEHAGAPEMDSLLLLATARKAYDKTRASAEKIYNEALATAWKVYDETLAPARKIYDETLASAWKVYNEACFYSWFNLFSEPSNRIAIWREAC